MARPLCQCWRVAQLAQRHAPRLLAADGHIATQRSCVVLSIIATSGAGLAAQRGSQRPAIAIPSSWHCPGTRDMSLETKRCRHVAVAMPIAAIGLIVTMDSCQQCPQPQQPDVAYHRTLVDSAAHSLGPTIWGFHKSQILGDLRRNDGRWNTWTSQQRVNQTIVEGGCG